MLAGSTAARHRLYPAATVTATNAPTPSATAPATHFTTLRTVWDPSSKDFVWGAEKPDEYGELPRIKEWIRNKNPNIYWFLLKIANRTDHPVKTTGSHREERFRYRQQQKRVRGRNPARTRCEHPGKWRKAVDVLQD
jgi:hypothetical protein